MEQVDIIPQELCEEFSLEQMAERLLTELDTPDFPGLMSGTGSGGSFIPNPAIKKAWRYLHDEGYSLICTNSSKYAAERKTFTVLTKPLILAFGGLVSHQFGLAVSTASGIAALALAMPLKMGRNAWCHAYKDGLKARPEVKDEKREYLGGERRQLIQLTRFQKKLTHKSPKERQEGISQIRRYRIDPEVAVPPLVRALQDENGDVRGEAAYVLRDIGPPARSAIPSMVIALHDPDVWVRRHAAMFFRHFPTDAPEFLEPLADALKDPDSFVRAEAADSLGRLGVAALPALKSLELALEVVDPKGQMRADPLSGTRDFSNIYFAILSIKRAEN